MTVTVRVKRKARWETGEDRTGDPLVLMASWEIIINAIRTRLHDI